MQNHRIRLRDYGLVASEVTRVGTDNASMLYKVQSLMASVRDLLLPCASEGGGAQEGEKTRERRFSQVIKGHAPRDEGMRIV